LATPHSDFSQLLGSAMQALRPGELGDASMSRENQLLRRILESDAFVVVITDAEGRIEYANPRFTQLTGYPLAEVLGGKPSALKSGTHPDSYYANLWQTITRGEIWKGDFHNRRKDGTLFWESCTIQPLYEPDGTIGHFLAIKEDITAAKELALQVEQSERKYRALFDRMDSAYALHELIRDASGRVVDYRFLEVNPYFEQLLGIPRGALLGKTVLEVLPDTEPYWIDSYAEVVRTRTPLRFENFSGGANSWFGGTAFALEGDQFGVLFTNITERKNMEQRNQTLLTELETQVRQLELLYWLSSLATRQEISVDQLFEEALGALTIAFAQVSGNLTAELHWRDQVLGSATGEEALGANKYVELASESWEFERQETRVVVRGPAECRTAFGDADRRLLRIFLKELVVIADLRGKQHEIERQQQQIMQASKLVSLGELTGGVAHEINNPTNYILLSVDILRDLHTDLLGWLARSEAEPAAPSEADGATASEARPEGGARANEDGHPDLAKMRHDLDRFLDSVQEGAVRIRDIVAKLKAYSLHQQDEKLGSVRLADVVASASRIAASRIKRSNATMVIELPETVPPVRGSYQLLEQLCLNLLTNALQAMEQREGQVTVTAELVDAEHLRLTIADEGVGIPADNLSRLTDPFFTTYRARGGLGLGLSIAARIVQDHQGTLEFFSEPGKGTSACVVLPLWFDQAADSDAAVPGARLPDAGSRG